MPAPCVHPPRRVLIAADEACRTAVRAALPPPTPDVVEAASCADALRVAAEAEPDVALVGVDLAPDGGYDLCRLLRGAHAALPVVLVGVPTDGAIRRRAVEAGASELVAAPIEPIELRLRIAALLAARGQAEQGARLAHLERLRDAIGAVVHDLRSPLGGAVLELSVVDAAALGADDREALDGAALSLQRVAAIVDDFLEVRRLETGATPSLAKEALAEAVADAVRSADGAARARKIAVRVTAPARVEVMADRALLSRAIANVVQNSIRYSPAGGTVEIALAAEGDRAVVEISDRGPAVPEAERRALLEEYALPCSIRRGTGVGLHLAWRVALAFGGNLEARERAGGGALFRLELPVART